MREITIYEADDGTRFNTLTEAVRHDACIAVVAEIMAPLADIPTPRGQVHYQLTRPQMDAVKTAKLALLSLAAPLVSTDPDYPMRKRIDAVGVAICDRPEQDDGTAGGPRWDDATWGIGECAPKPIRRAWARLANIDSAGRVFEQGYDRANPHETRRVTVGAEASTDADAASAEWVQS